MLMEDEADDDAAVAAFAPVDEIVAEEPPPLEEEGFLFSTPFADAPEASADDETICRPPFKNRTRSTLAT